MGTSNFRRLKSCWINSSQVDPVQLVPTHSSPSFPPRKSYYFLAGYALEEIQISTAETRISILPYQTLFVTGGWRHPALPNVPQTYPRTMIPVLRKLLTKPESEKREGGWAQAIFVA